MKVTSLLSILLAGSLTLGVTAHAEDPSPTIPNLSPELQAALSNLLKSLAQETPTANRADTSGTGDGSDAQKGNPPANGSSDSNARNGSGGKSGCHKQSGGGRSGSGKQKPQPTGLQTGSLQSGSLQTSSLNTSVSSGEDRMSNEAWRQLFPAQDGQR